MTCLSNIVHVLKARTATDSHSLNVQKWTEGPWHTLGHRNEGTHIQQRVPIEHIRPRPCETTEELRVRIIVQNPPQLRSPNM